MGSDHGLETLNLKLETQFYRGVTHPGRTQTARERGVRRGAPASRPDQVNFGFRSADFELKSLGYAQAVWNFPKSAIRNSNSEILSGL